MGWDGIHLFQFSLRAARYGSRELSASSSDVTLAALRLRKGARFVYEYDLNIPWKSCSPTFPVRGCSKPSQHSTNRSILASPGVSHTLGGRIDHARAGQHPRPCQANSKCDPLPRIVA